MNFKRVMALLLAFVLVLSACGQTNNDTAEEGSQDDTVSEESNTEDDTNEESGAAEEGDEELAEANLVFWHAMNGAQEESLKKLTEEFTKQNPNVTVDLQNQTGYQELQQKLTATSASPDNLPTLTQAYPDWMYNLIQDGLVHDLSEYTSSLEDYEDILEGFRNGTKIDDKTYSMPFNKSTEVLWYNEDMFNELGLEVPTTPEELLEVSKTIHEKKGIAALGFDSLSNYYTTFLKNKGVTYDQEFDPTSQESKDVINYYLDGVKEGYFRISGTDRFMSGPFGNEQVAMYIGSNAGESYVVEGVGDKFTPKAAKSPFSPSIQQGTDIFMFNTEDENVKKAAYAYLTFLTNTENQITWAIDTGYIPVRATAVQSDDYKNSGSLIAPILEDATKELYSNPVVGGANDAYREAGTMLEDILANPDSADVDAKLEQFKTTLEGLWN